MEISESVKRIEDLLMYLELQDKIVVVEQNGIILQQGDYSKVVKSTDTIEIVTFVGGG